MRRSWLALSAVLPAVPAAASAETGSGPAVGAEYFYSGDSDGTEVARAALDLDVSRTDETRYVGLRLEKARYNPNDRGWESRDRIFVRAAARAGDWQLRGSVGTDGHSLIGSLSAHDEARFRKELFVERDVVETAQGLDRDIYSTFVGGAVDLPADDRNVLTLLAGVQEFTGDNVRLHLRGSFVHVVKPDWGLSAQLRARWFRSSEPGEYDYYSPRHYAQILPVLQVRRFTRGWELVGAAGFGVQRDSGTDWRGSRYVHARFRKPAGKSAWSVNGALTYTDTPSVSGTSRPGYSYVQMSLGVSRRF